MSLGYEIQENAPRPANTGAVTRCDLSGLTYPCVCITHTEDIPEKCIPQDVLTTISNAISSDEEVKPEYKDITKPVEEIQKYPLYLFIQYQGQIKQTLLLGKVPITYLDTLFNLVKLFDLIVYIKNEKDEIVALTDDFVNLIIPRI